MYFQWLWVAVQAFIARRLVLWSNRLSPKLQGLAAIVRTPVISDQTHEQSASFEHLYKFEALSGPRNIRLVRTKSLLPLSWKGSIGAETGELHYILEEFELENAPPFSALSHRWDSEGPKDMICIGDKKALSISVSLKKALFHLSRTRSWDSYYWIDAVCINQEDLRERNTQVLLMHDVYSLATETVVWLGEAFENDNFALHIHAGVASGAFGINFVATDAARATDNPLHSAAFTSNYWQDRMFTLGVTLEAVLSRPWFSRIWMTQEVALAKKITVESVNGRLSWDCLVQATRTQAVAQKDARRPVYEQALKLMEARDLFQSRVLSFEHVLSFSRTFNATDARDKIYGLLGLNAEFAAIIGKPDYSKSVEEVFMDGTRAFMSKLSIKALHLMSSEVHCDQIPEPLPFSQPVPTWIADMDRVAVNSGPKRTSIVPNKPSWVGNFENPSLSWPMDNRNVEEAFGNPKFQIEGSLLRVKGTIIDTVDAVSTWSKTSGNNRQMWLTWNQWLQESGITDGEKPSLGRAGARHIREDGHSQALVVWRTMACDLDNQMTDGEALLFWHHWFEDELGMNVLMWDSRLMMDRDTDVRFNREFDISTAKLRNATRHKVLFSTELGSKFGLGPQNVMKGDLVVFFAGYNVPFLLRRMPRSCKFFWMANPPAHQLLGPCFVHGLMNGEQCDWKEFKWEELVLE